MISIRTEFLVSTADRNHPFPPTGSGQSVVFEVGWDFGKPQELPDNFSGLILTCAGVFVLILC